jgi:hypothetical protein
MNSNSIITITLGDMAENHAGMEQIGQMVPEGQGFNLNDLNHIKQTFDDLGIETELINLASSDLNNINSSNSSNNTIPPAYILIIRDGINAILNIESEYDKNQLFLEQSQLNVDKQAFMYGRVVNKKARWNLCFDDNDSEPNYQEGKGRVISWNNVPITNTIYQNLQTYFGPKSSNLKGEGNYYYDVTQCGIGFHGDGERRKVIGLRLGASMPLYYQWFFKGNPIGSKMSFPLNGGDIYIMSEKAVGTDWKKKNIYTLRHATGSNKFTDV